MECGPWTLPVYYSSPAATGTPTACCTAAHIKPRNWLFHTLPNISYNPFPVQRTLWKADSFHVWKVLELPIFTVYLRPEPSPSTLGLCTGTGSSQTYTYSLGLLPQMRTQGHAFDDWTKLLSWGIFGSALYVTINSGTGYIYDILGLDSDNFFLSICKTLPNWRKGVFADQSEKVKGDSIPAN